VISAVPDQEAALKELAAGEGGLLTLAKILRRAAHLLETWSLPKTDLVRSVEGLCSVRSRHVSGPATRLTRRRPTGGRSHGSQPRDALPGADLPKRQWWR